MHLIFLILGVLGILAIPLDAAKLKKEKDPIDYNSEIDKTLAEIENSVRNQSESSFATHFSSSFDAEDWYRKFMKLTPEQAETYSISRFGDVQDGRSVQFTESVRMNETFTRRTPFDAVFVEVPVENDSEKVKLVIDALIVHEAKSLEPEEE